MFMSYWINQFPIAEVLKDVVILQDHGGATSITKTTEPHLSLRLPFNTLRLTFTTILSTVIINSTPKRKSDQWTPYSSLAIVQWSSALLLSILTFLFGITFTTDSTFLLLLFLHTTFRCKFFDQVFVVNVCIRVSNSVALIKMWFAWNALKIIKLTKSKYFVEWITMQY